MGLTSAMLVGFTGIKSNQYTIDTVGDNVANVNTTAFKNQRALFETVHYTTIADGTAPNGPTQGGTNPRQTGLGSRLAALDRNFEPGSIEGTGSKSDVAIDGDGFLIVESPDNSQFYTRDGSLRLDAENKLVASNGYVVQGFAADSNGEIITGALSELAIPIGIESEAIATTVAEFDGNLDAGASLSTRGAESLTEPLLTAGGTASDSTALTSIVDDEGVALFNDGDVIQLRNIQKGGIDLQDSSFVVGTDGSTLGDFATFLQNKMAIDTSLTTADGQTPGVTIDATGALVVVSNAGEPNAISIDASDIRNETSGRLPFAFSTTPATGEGVSTAMIVFDSLGNPVEVRLRASMETRNESGTVWRFFVESTDDSDATPLLGTGTLTFDQDGQLVSSSGTEVMIDQTEAGSATPLTFTLDVENVTGLNFGNNASSLVLATQDGSPGGTLIDYQINQQGIIVGTFSNGRTQQYGQLALATFRNNAGLTAMNDNNYIVGVNSGDAQISAPQVQGAGSIASNSLELSNVDLSREFVNLITASTGFSAASRVVRSADDMLQELLLLAR